MLWIVFAVTLGSLIYVFSPLLPWPQDGGLCGAHAHFYTSSPRHRIVHPTTCHLSLGVTTRRYRANPPSSHALSSHEILQITSPPHPSQLALFFFFNDAAPPEFSPLPLHGAFPI